MLYATMETTAETTNCSIAIGAVVLPIGVILFRSAYRKIISGMAYFELAIIRYRLILPKYSWFVARVLLSMEVCTVVLLFIPMSHRVGAVMLMVISGIFFIAQSSVLIRGFSIECGCGGTQSELVSWRTAAIPAILFIAAALVLSVMRLNFPLDNICYYIGGIFGTLVFFHRNLYRIARKMDFSWFIPVGIILAIVSSLGVACFQIAILAECGAIHKQLGTIYGVPPSNSDIDERIRALVGKQSPLPNDSRLVFASFSCSSCAHLLRGISDLNFRPLTVAIIDMEDQSSIDLVARRLAYSFYLIPGSELFQKLGIDSVPLYVETDKNGLISCIEELGNINQLKAAFTKETVVS